MVYRIHHRDRISVFSWREKVHVTLLFAHPHTNSDKVHHVDIYLLGQSTFAKSVLEKVKQPRPFYIEINHSSTHYLSRNAKTTTICSFKGFEEAFVKVKNTLLYDLSARVTTTVALRRFLHSKSRILQCKTFAKLVGEELCYSCFEGYRRHSFVIIGNAETNWEVDQRSNLCADFIGYLFDKAF